MNQEKLSKYVRLITDSSASVRETAEDAILSLAHKYRDDIFTVLYKISKENIDDQDKCAQCTNVISSFVHANEISLFHKTILIDLIIEIISKHSDNNSTTSKNCIDIIKVISADSNEIILKFLTKFEAFNSFNPAALEIFHQILRNRNNHEVIEHIVKNIKEVTKILNQKEAQKYRQLFSKIFLISLDQFIKDSQLTNEDKSNAASSIFDAVIDTFFEQDVPLNDKIEGFSILLKASDLIDESIYGQEVSKCMTKTLVLVLEDPLYEVTVSAISHLLSRLDDKSQIKPFIQTSCQQIIRRMLKLSENALTILKYYEQIDHNITLDLILQTLKDDHPENTLAILDSFFKDKLINESDATKIISAINILINAQTSLQARISIFHIWEGLVLLGVDTNSLFPGIVKIASSPLYKELFKEFEEVCDKVKDDFIYPDILSIALDDKSIIISPILFRLCRSMKGSLECRMFSGNPLATKGLIYANSQYFTLQSRADILYCCGRVLGESDYLTCAEKIEKKQCNHCAHKEIHQLNMRICKEKLNTESWVLSAQSVIDNLVQAKHADVPTRPILQPNESKYFQASLFCFATSSLMAIYDGSPQIFMTKIQPFYSKFDQNHIEEVQQFGFCLVDVSHYNQVTGSEIFRTKLEQFKRTFSRNDLTNRRITLEYQYRCGTIDQYISDLVLDSDLPQQLSSHAQRRIIKKNVDNIQNIQKHIQLLDKLLLSKDISVIKAAVETFLFLVKQNKIPEKVNISTPLKKCFAALKLPHSEELIKDKVMELIYLTKVEINFSNICIFVFNEEAEFATFAVKTLVDIVNKADSLEQLKTPATCASISLLLNNKEYFNDGLILSQKIFQSNRPPEEFALQFFLSTGQEERDQFIPFLFSFLNLPEPWCYYAEHVISGLTNDQRFSQILDLAFTHFGASVTTSRTGIFKELGTCLFKLDKQKFISTLLMRNTIPQKQVITLFSSLFDIVGETLLQVATETKVEEKMHLHLATIRIIAAVNGMKDEMLVNSLVFICLALAQNPKLLNESKEAITNLSRWLPELATPRVKSCLEDASASDGTISFVTIRSLFTAISSKITVYHLAAFLKFAPYGALAGYCEIISAHGRPMLPEIMQQSKIAPNAVLLTLPSIKQLQPDRYGEYMLGLVLDFIIEQMDKDEEAFKCLLELFYWIPQKLIMDKSIRIFESTINALRVEKPPQPGFTVLSMLGESKYYFRNKDFRHYLWMMAVISLGFSEDTDLQLVAVARTALCSLAQHAAMYGTVAIVQQNIGKLDGFSIDILPTFIREMDLECIDAACNLVEDPNVKQRIRAAEVICASIHNGLGIERSAYRRILPLLASTNDEIKKGVLNAIKVFPPKL